MALVTRKFTCKNCEETQFIQYSQEEIKTKEVPEKDEEYLVLLGLCKPCFDGKIG